MSVPKTMFQLSGRGYAPANLSHATLVIIDAQKEYLSGPLALSGMDAAVENIKQLSAAARKAGQKVADARKWIAGKRDLSREWKNRKTTARQVIRDSFRDLMHGFGLQ